MQPSSLTLPAGLMFADYFDLDLETHEVVTHFGYGYTRAASALPHADITIPWIDDLADRLTTSLLYVSLASTGARREFLIAPILLDLARYQRVKVRVECQLEVSAQLRGILDYCLQAQRQLLVVNAKHADLQRGFTQLAAELIALDRRAEGPAHQLYGAVSAGNLWQFGWLDRADKQISQDPTIYRVPGDLRSLLQVLLAILQPPG